MCMSLPPRVVLASDHAGFPLKERVKLHLQQQGIVVDDVGTHSEEPVDYPPIIRAGCERAQTLQCPAIIFGGSGNGEAMAANRLRGMRAAVCWNEESARLARAHNDANALSLGGRLLDHHSALGIVDTFLSTSFEGGRHVRRIALLDS